MQKAVLPISCAVLLGIPSAGFARPKASAKPPAAIVSSCLSQCSAESSRCSRSGSGREGDGRRRGRGALRRCGCAYVTCKQSCRSYGLPKFQCSASSRPYPLPLPRTPARRCKKDSDCTFAPPAPCACRPCGVSWRQPVNRKEARRLRQHHRRVRCAALRCQRCPRFELGKRAYCGGAGYCEVGL